MSNSLRRFGERVFHFIERKRWAVFKKAYVDANYGYLRPFSVKRFLISDLFLLNTSFHCLFYLSVFSDAEKSDCGLRDNPAVNYIRLSSRRGQINDQTYVGFLRISDNEPVPSPIRVFHWDTYSMYGSDRDQEFPVYLMDVIGFGENLFVQMETTAPAPIRRRSKKRSQKKASERRLSKQAVVTEG